MSMKSKARRDQRKQAEKKAQNRIQALRPRSSAFHVSDKVYRRMTQRHPDVLQNIEFALVSTWRSHRAIDDGDVKQALVASLRGVPAEDVDALRLQQSLDSMRDQRVDIADELWRDGLRVVLHSVHNHSTATSGATGYLRFVQDFVI